MHKPCFTVRLTKLSHGSGSEGCLDKRLFLYYFEETMCCDDPVLNPGKGVCADPVERGAILEVEGPGLLGTLFDPCRLAYLAYTSND